MPYCIRTEKGSYGPQYWPNSGLVLALDGIALHQELPCHCGPGLHMFKVYILLIIQRQFLCYISYGVKYTSVINPNLKYRNVSSVFEEIQI